MKTNGKKILIVDDEQLIRNLLARMLGTGYEIVMAENGRQAVEKAAEQSFDIAFVDIVMPGMDGIETLKGLKAVQPDLKLVVMTGFAVEDRVVQAFDLGAEDCLYKPFTLREVESVIQKVGVPV